jgi:hypothetical protein
MTKDTLMFKSRRQRWSAVMFAASLLWSSSSGARAQEATQQGTQTQKPAKPQQKPPAAPAEKIEWLKDAEGREYRLEPIPKTQATKVSDTKIRTIFGVPADLAREDEKFFYIKLYKTEPAPITKTPAPAESARGAKPSSSPAGKAGKAGVAGAAGSGNTDATGVPRTGARPAEPLPPASARLRWTAAGTGLPAKGQWREGLVLADVTGDGRLDIAASGARKTLRPPVFFTFDGKTWTALKDITFAPRPFDYGDLALADIDGDGTLDAALGIHLRGLMAFRRGADGKFADASTGLPFAANNREQAFSSRAVALSDCNADGRLDLVAIGEGPRLPGQGVDPNVAMGLATYVQQADGSWQAAQRPDAAGLFGASLEMADVDGDKKLDAIVAPGTLGDTRLVLRGDGACGWTAEPIDAVRPRSYVTAAAAGDVTGDGNPELVVGYVEFSSDEPSYGVDVLTRGAEGQWTRRALARETGRTRTEAIAIGDLDGDKRADVVTVGAAGAATIFLADGRGGVTRERQTLPSPGGCQGASAAIGDLDADGLGDIVISYAQESSATTPGVCTNEGGIAAWKTAKAAPKPTGR